MPSYTVLVPVLVGPSMTNPAEYYDNNFVRTKIALRLVGKTKNQNRLIFSSSAATYGNPIMTPCQEVDPTEPISPYGQSKLMIDWMLASYQHAYGLDYVVLDISMPVVQTVKHAMDKPQVPHISLPEY
jgi:UDP-glucose 4-epimerase